LVADAENFWFKDDWYFRPGAGWQLALDSALHRLDRARELGEQAVAHQLDDPAAVPGDPGPEQLPAVGLRAARVPASSSPMRRE
jgi:hypothetical protein